MFSRFGCVSFRSYVVALSAHSYLLYDFFRFSLSSSMAIHFFFLVATFAVFHHFIPLFLCVECLGPFRVLFVSLFSLPVNSQ